jgi:hypothetical protein
VSHIGVAKARNHGDGSTNDTGIFEAKGIGDKDCNKGSQSSRSSCSTSCSRPCSMAATRTRSTASNDSVSRLTTVGQPEPNVWLVAPGAKPS